MESRFTWRAWGATAMRLMGHYEHTLDDKGRLAIPAKFRDRLGDAVVLTNGHGMCILGYPAAEWELVEKAMDGLSAARKEDVDLLRLIYSRAEDCEIDKQGRILLPAKLREYAQIKDAVMVVGMGRWFEIWNKDNWQPEQARLEVNREQIIQRHGENGLKL